ncbi:MAG: hypothetical protein EA383_04975 [Spirochaetaceae bacterium]|nr:MAG: hypothetical protein EA383_04975 [Spirochaetaceae bacterium]
MSMRSRLIIIVLLFPLLTISFIAVSPIRLASEPSLGLVSLVAPGEASTQQDAAGIAHEWFREPTSRFLATSRTAEHVVVMDHRAWQAVQISDPLRLDRSDAGAVTLIDGAPAVLRAGHDPARLVDQPAAVLRGSQVFAIDRDGSGFAWLDGNMNVAGQIRLAGPIVALETSPGHLWVADALGFVYLFDGSDAEQPGEFVSLRRPTLESGGAVYGLSVNPDGRAAVVEGLHPARVTILNRSGEDITAREVLRLDGSMNRPRHITWVSDDLLLETERGVARIDAGSGDITPRDLPGRVVGLGWLESLDLILVLTDSYASDARSRLHILYADDLSELSTLVFPAPAYSLSYDGRLVSIGLEDVVLLYEVSD